jgi:hypothetical protein
MAGSSARDSPPLDGSPMQFLKDWFNPGKGEKQVA